MADSGDRGWTAAGCGSKVLTGVLIRRSPVDLLRIQKAGGSGNEA
jgi:hypothetical protein